MGTEAANLTTTTWAIDPTHTEVQFKVKHLVISTVTGFFKKFEGTVETETDDFDGAKINFSLDTNSIDTNQADRDAHLKSADFFAADQYPKLTFAGVLNKKGDDYSLDGEMTIRDTTRSISLAVDFGGIMDDPWGNTKAGFEINGKIKRTDFGLNWNTITEAGGVLVGEEVKIHINAQLAKG